MDAMDILGGLLRGATSSGGSGSASSMGGKILSDLLKSGTAPSAPKQTKSAAPRRGSVSQQPVDIQAEARRLEEMLGVATGGRREPSRTEAPKSPPKPPMSGSIAPTKGPKPILELEPPAPEIVEDEQEEAIVLARAMINAAKADGKLDAQEQQFILGRVSNDQETIEFLRSELAKPLDVRDFAWSVPLGMEVQVYTLSMATIKIDTEAEIRYLRDLAHGLRMAPELCNEIHSRYGIKAIF
jgi:hypothetical protein